jgi:Reverse transcriptase (RNA-dependent DNA polymerase)
MIKLKTTTLDWALAHVKRFGGTDVLPTPFEYDAIEHSWSNIKSYLSNQNLFDWNVRAQRTLLAPKSRYAFRVITQIDPLDFLIFSSLIREIAGDLENSRVPTNRQIVFSYRLAVKPDGQLFDPSIGYDNFIDRTKELLRDKKVTHVAVADIADFYSRIYHHRLEGALANATTKTNHVKAIIRLLSGWNSTETFGIPVGNAPSRALAEALLCDVDDALLSYGINFIRYNDDYRIFTSNYAEAYRYIAFLAEVLYQNHGLTCQPQKTFILTKNEFRARFLATPEEREIDSLSEKFQQLIADLGLSDPYEEIDYDDLDEEQQALVDSLNLVDLFKEEIQKSDVDFGILKFVLRRMGQLGDDSLVGEIFDNLDIIFPTFPDIIQYFRNLRNLSPERYRDIGRQVLDLLNESLVSELNYHRMWALDLFTRSTQWDNEKRFFKMLGEARDVFSKRKLILAMGRSHQRHWFQSQWRNLSNESPWPRRAVLAGASCMNTDARNHWYRAVMPQLDELEKAVVRWAKANPF